MGLPCVKNENEIKMKISAWWKNSELHWVSDVIQFNHLSLKTPKWFSDVNIFCIAFQFLFPLLMLPFLFQSKGQTKSHTVFLESSFSTTLRISDIKLHPPDERLAYVAPENNVTELIPNRRTKVSISKTCSCYQLLLRNTLHILLVSSMCLL